MLAVLPNEWINSDPKKLYLWFKQVCEITRGGGQLRRFIQYIKNWSAQKFSHLDKEFQPTSIMLTVLVTNAYLILSNDMPEADDDGFTLIVNKVLSKLNTNRTVPNPVDSSEDLNGLSEEGCRNFIIQLTELRDIAVAVRTTGSRFHASRLWEKAFSHFFPIDAESYSYENLPAHIAPEIEIDVSETEKGTPFIYGAKNAINSIPKGCRLNFRITNPRNLPLGCTVEWVVRNSGREAMNTNDMGHNAIGEAMFEHQEHTAYYGTHYMDCSIYDSEGRLYSFRRVPVSVLSRTKEQIRRGQTSNYRQLAKRKSR